MIHCAVTWSTWSGHGLLRMIVPDADTDVESNARAPRARATHGRRLVFLLLTPILAITLCLGLLEVGLRVYCRIKPSADVEFFRYANLMKTAAPGRDVRFMHQPGSRLRLFGVDVEINSRGFRDVEIPATRTEGTKRILVLGDSVTFGWGVPYGQRFTEIVARHWSNEGDSRYELINTGHGNYNSAQEYALLAEQFEGEPLDGVIQVWYINDAEPVPTHRDAPWYSHVYTYIFFWSKRDLIRRRLGDLPTYVDYYKRLYEADAPGRAGFDEALASTGRWTSQRSLPWVFVVLPEFHAFGDDGPFADIYHRVKRSAAAAGAKVVDATSAFHGHDPSSIWVAYNDVHPNATGHAIIARTILEQVDKSEFKDGPQ